MHANTFNRRGKLLTAGATLCLAAACGQNEEASVGADTADAGGSGSAVMADVNSIRGEPSEANHFIRTPEGWQHPMTEWGDPDISATLDMMQAAGVPLERCANRFGRGGVRECDMNKVWNTEAEYEEAVAQAEGRVDTSTQALEEGNLGLSIRTGLTDPNIPQRQTNLIVDPPSGLLPHLTPSAKEQAHLMGSDWSLPGETINFQDQSDFDSWDRCITRGLPSMMMPYRYNGGFKIHQSPGHVVFDIEMIHEVRVIPVHDAPPLDDEIRQHLGESRGYWDGMTLVVETTNFDADPSINRPLINLAVVGSPPGNRFPVSGQMKITERVTRLNDEVWLYEITTEDPEVLEGPFTVRYPLRHDPEYWWPEYACHEDNTIVPNYVSANRAERANPAPEPPQEPQQVGEEVAEMLDGRWIGQPDVHTIDYQIEVEFTDNGDGTVNGRLIGTTLAEGNIDRPLRNFQIADGNMTFTFPNADPWSYSGSISLEDEAINGFSSSAQGGVELNFRPAN
ncbi:MAG TPA: hypothetical protein VMR74_07790 [Gammaproteobacteria bacterium]|nr:hypothetical protein [Gammaproteobacteria bacterium]